MLWRIYTWNWYAIKPVCFLNDMSTVCLWAMIAWGVSQWTVHKEDNTSGVLPLS